MPQERLIHYSTTTAQYYEDKSILTSYDRFHFGPGLLGVKNFPQRMAEVAFTRRRILIYSNNYFQGVRVSLQEIWSLL